MFQKRKNAADWNSLSEQEKKARIRHARFRERNREKIREQSKNWATRNPDKVRNKHLMDHYGITLEQYNALLAKQNNCCAICCDEKPNNVTKNMHVDHCHTTGKVRGLLCDRCNRGLGLFKERAELLEKAISYLSHE